MPASDTVTVVKNPRLILAVSLHSDKLTLGRVATELSGTLVQISDEEDTTTVPLIIKNTYYAADIPLLLASISSDSKPADFADIYLLPEAKDLLDALGGLMIVFSLPSAEKEAETREVIEQIGRILTDGLGGWEWRGVNLAVGVGEGSFEKWEDICMEAGWVEFVQLTGREENNGREKKGIARIKEALEINEWEQDTPTSDFGDFEGPKEGEVLTDDETGGLDFGFDKADFAELRAALWASGQDDVDKETDEDDGGGIGNDDVEKMERMMVKLLAVREAGVGLGEQQKKKMAAKAVAEVMKEL